jgi:hypothetical protein
MGDVIEGRRGCWERMLTVLSDSGPNLVWLKTRHIVVERFDAL